MHMKINADAVHTCTNINQERYQQQAQVCKHALHCKPEALSISSGKLRKQTIIENLAPSL